MFLTIPGGVSTDGTRFAVSGLVLFLEEDHYVAEDFVLSLRLAETLRNEQHPDVDILCIGTYLKTYNYNRDHKTVTRVYPESGLVSGLLDMLNLIL